LLLENRASPLLQEEKHEWGLQLNGLEQNLVDVQRPVLPRNPDFHHAVLLHYNALATDADEA